MVRGLDGIAAALTRLMPASVAGRLTLAVVAVATLVATTGYFGARAVSRMLELRAQEVPLQRDLGHVEGSLWTAVQAANAFRLSGDPVFADRFREQIATSERALVGYRRRLEHEIEREGADELGALVPRIRLTGEGLIETTRRQTEAEDRLFRLVDAADDVIDVEIQKAFSAADPRVLEKERAVREVEVSIWEAIHAAQQYTGLSAEITRAGHAQATFGELMEKQLEDVAAFWAVYRRLADSDEEIRGARAFEAIWNEAEQAARDVIRCRDEAMRAFVTLRALVAIADEVLEERLEPAMQRHIEAHDARARRSARGLVATTVVSLVFVAGGGLVAARGFLAPIRTLTAATRRLSSPGADLGERVPVMSRDEFGQLASSFNAMTAQLDRDSKALKHEAAERQQAEHEARRLLAEVERHRRRLDDLVGSLPGLVWEIEGGLRTGEVRSTFLSDYVETLLGYDRAELLAAPDLWFEILHPADQERFLKRFMAMFEEGRGGSETFRCVRKDGSVIWAEMHMAVIRDEGGKPAGIRGVTMNVTARKMAELELEKVQRQLVDASREAGMAVVATNVLHNVGNVLNSVNVTATILSDHLRRSRVRGVAKVAELLDENRDRLSVFLTEDEKGKQLTAYLEALAKHLAGEREMMAGELETLRTNIDHVKQIVSRQQSYVAYGGVTETIPLEEVVEDALRLNAESLERHGIEIVREYHDAVAIPVDKHRILQIVVNLVRNAKHALEACDPVGRRLTVSIGQSEGTVRISVTDNGVGIPEENMPRLFQHGFTTRKGGHGFGLHSAALAADDLGGTVTAHSDGPGTGATFTLELPAAEGEAAA